MRLRIEEVRHHGPLDLEETIPAGRMFPELTSPVRLRVHAEAFDDEILALVSAEALAALECARCLERFERPLKSSLELHAPFTGGDLEIDEEVRQSLLLALPVKPLCRPDCKGLCPRCGRNWNTGACSCGDEKGGEPFAALKNLKLK